MVPRQTQKDFQPSLFTENISRLPVLTHYRNGRNTIRRKTEIQLEPDFLK
jgi:hypothetical protein